MKQIKAWMIFVLLLGLFFLISFMQLRNHHPVSQFKQDALVGDNVPPFQFINILQPDSSAQNTFNNQSLMGHVSLVNFWATWCEACHAEHALLMKLHEQYHFPIYGIAYKDSEEEVKSILERDGNPYTMVGLDHDGNTAVDFGVYATPETFMVNPQGKIIYQHIGMLNEEVINNEILPLINAYQKIDLN